MLTRPACGRAVRRIASRLYSGGVSIAPVELERPDSLEAEAPDLPWITIVWNDPVNLMSYVTYVFESYFGYPRSKAEKLMLDVHKKGRAVVSNGTREEMEKDTEAMHEYGLWATFQKDT
jgi:ATP-dependent Clp protease adaptor protein ClpS